MQIALLPTRQVFDGGVMALPLDNYLGIHPQAFKLSARRSEVLAANLANADTPNFKAQDVDFKAALAASGTTSSTLPMVATHASHIPLNQPGDALTAQLKYRVPNASSLDGNTVDSQMEQSNFAQNAVRYQASLTFINGKFRNLMTAITGQ
jgi:flagellar basal-body rod protein FlgB